MSQKHVRGEGGSGENQGEKEWWEGDRRERGNGEKQSGEGRREDDMRERGGTSKGEKDLFCTVSVDIGHFTAHFLIHLFLFVVQILNIAHILGMESLRSLHEHCIHSLLTTVRVYMFTKRLLLQSFVQHIYVRIKFRVHLFSEI